MEDVKESNIRISDNIIVSSSQDEGILYDVENHKSYWVNESACILFQFLKKNPKGLSLRSINHGLNDYYKEENQSAIIQDITSFISDLKTLNIVNDEGNLDNITCEVLPSTSQMKYLKPIILEGSKDYPRNTIGLKTGVSKAVSQARHSGLRAF